MKFPKGRHLTLVRKLLLAGFLLASVLPQPCHLQAAPVPYAGKVAVNGLNVDGTAKFTFALRDANFTIALWLKSTDVRGGNTAEWHKQNTLLTRPNDTYGMLLHQGKFSFWLNTLTENNANNKMRQTSDGSINTGSWVHLALSREAGVGNSGSYLAYVNGSKDSGPFSKGAKFNTGALLYMGKAITEANYYLNGGLDDLRIYDRTLSDAEVKALHDLGQ